MKNYIRLRAALCASAVLLISGHSISRAAEARAPMEPRISVITLGVADLQKSYQFYKTGLGFPTTMTPQGGVVLFTTTGGTQLFLYPYAKLAADIGMQAPDVATRPAFPGFTLIHLVRRQQDVSTVLNAAQRAGGKIVKPAAANAAGGFTGYFSDPDGYLWEVTYSAEIRFNPDGSVAIE